MSNEHYPRRWIGRGGPVAWPPGSPDLAAFRRLKETVYATEIATRDTLVQRIRDAVVEISRERREIRRVTNSITFM